MSAKIIPLFRNDRPEAVAEINLETAVDVAIRDLHDIEAHWGTTLGLRRLRECRELLAKAFSHLFCGRGEVDLEPGFCKPAPTHGTRKILPMDGASASLS